MQAEEPTLSAQSEMHKLKEKPIKEYGPWEVTPEVAWPIREEQPSDDAEMQAVETMHEGTVTYLRLWNFLVRAGTPAAPADYHFFHDYESTSPYVQDLIASVGAPTSWPSRETEVWSRISIVWNWLGSNVRIDGAAYGALVDAAGRWPSIAELAGYYRENGELVWSACFSKAHLFALLLGRVLPRWHTTMVSAHHTENGAPPTASHVYVGVYLTGRWYYLDPTAVYHGPLPNFADRRSVGLFTTVDYEHPFKAAPVPLSPLSRVPLLSA